MTAECCGSQCFTCCAVLCRPAAMPPLCCAAALRMPTHSVFLCCAVLCCALAVHSTQALMTHWDCCAFLLPLTHSASPSLSLFCCVCLSVSLSLFCCVCLSVVSLSGCCQVGECCQVFQVASCQDGSVEFGLAHPSEEVRLLDCTSLLCCFLLYTAVSSPLSCSTAMYSLVYLLLSLYLSVSVCHFCPVCLVLSRRSGSTASRSARCSRAETRSSCHLGTYTGGSVDRRECVLCCAVLCCFPVVKLIILPVYLAYPVALHCAAACTGLRITPKWSPASSTGPSSGPWTRRRRRRRRG